MQFIGTSVHLHRLIHLNILHSQTWLILLYILLWIPRTRWSCGSGTTALQEQPTTQWTGRLTVWIYQTGYIRPVHKPVHFWMTHILLEVITLRRRSCRSSINCNAGHWFLDGWIGDHAVEFLVDSGLLVTAMSRPLYQSLVRAGAPVGTLRGTTRTLRYCGCQMLSLCGVVLWSDFWHECYYRYWRVGIGIAPHPGHEEWPLVHRVGRAIAVTLQEWRALWLRVHSWTLFCSPLFGSCATLYCTDCWGTRDVDQSSMPMRRSNILTSNTISTDKHNPIRVYTKYIYLNCYITPPPPAQTCSKQGANCGKPLTN